MRLKKILKAIIPSRLSLKLLTFRSVISSKLNGVYVESLLVKSGGYKFLVAVDDMVVGSALRRKGVYGENELKIISKLTNLDSTVVFIGAHIGAIAIPTAKQVRCAIFIEANPKTYEYLSLNILLNNLKNTVSYNVAAGEKDGEINFVMSKVNSGGSKREPLVKESMYYYDKPMTVTVPMVALDNLIDARTQVYDLILMDIEGSEFFALKGMTEILKKTKALVVEFLPHHLRNVANVSVSDFLSEIEVIFGYCYVPSQKQYLTRAEFLNFFEGMFVRDEGDCGLIFTTEFVGFM
jgi:FkbM family methyltransferase